MEIGGIYKFYGNRGEFINFTQEGEAKCRNFAEIGGIINFVEIGGICNMHHWIRGMDALANVIVQTV